MIPTRYRIHVLTGGLILGTTGLSYVTYKISMKIKSWTRANPRLQHQEMDDFLDMKYREAIRNQQDVVRS